MNNSNKRFAFLITLDMAEKIYSVPVEQRDALLLQMYKDKQAEFLGSTKKNSLELTIDLIKAGIRAKSYVAPNPKNTSK